MSLSHEEQLRYHRQIIMPEIGAEGQNKLKQATVFLAGLGGLGSISASYLVAGGIGHIRVVDGDRVTTDNLNRQILHWTDDIGRAKVDSGAEKLKRLNPNCHIEPVNIIIGKDNALKLTGDCAVIMDGTDNLETRKILNRVSIKKKIPLIFGGVEGLNGMVTTFIPGETGCLECLFPFQEKQQKTIGVICPLPGMVAAIQALEAIKLILGMDGLLKSTLLHIDGVTLAFTSVNIERNPDCFICGPNKEELDGST